jgi:O-antigen ligase
MMRPTTKRSRVTPELLMGGLIWTMGASSLLVALLPRSSLNSVVPGELPSVLPSDFKDASHIVNALFLIFLAFGLAYVSTHRSTARKAKSIWVTGILVSFALGLSAIFGAVPDREWKIVVWPLLITVVYLLPRVPLRWLLQQLQHFFMIVVVGSLALALLIPHWALANSESLSSFLNRSAHLQGLTAQYDGMGEVALLGFLTTYWLRGSRFRRISLGLCLLALAMSGARTSMLALMVAVACLWVYKEWASRSAKGIMVTLLSGASVIGVFYVAFSGFTGTSGYTANLGTLNGRTLVWALTIHQWRLNPLVGYGPTLWSAAYRLSHGVSNLTWVGMAHNQFIQTLGESGLVGLLALTAFVLALLGWAWRGRSADRGLALSLVLALLIIMITEAPLVLDALPVALYPAFCVLVVTMTSASLDRPSRDARPTDRTVVIDRSTAWQSR